MGASYTNTIITFHLMDRWAEWDAQVCCLETSLTRNYATAGQDEREDQKSRLKARN